MIMRNIEENKKVGLGFIIWAGDPIGLGRKMKKRKGEGKRWRNWVGLGRLKKDNKQNNNGNNNNNNNNS